MEAEHSEPTDGARSGGQQQTLSESSTGSRLPQIQEQATPQHGSRGRHQHRQPKRRDMLRKQQQQQSQVGESSWQAQDTPGPSGSSYFSSLLESSTHPHSIPSHPSKEVREGSSSRRERKPQKPGKYVCPYCGRPCAKPSVLQKHIRSHTGERPYPCVPCGFSFKTKSNLYKHRKSHAHRIKADLASSHEEYSFSGAESGTIGDEKEEATEADTTESEDETGQRRPKRSQERPALKKSSKVELSFSQESQRTEDSQAIKQRLAMRLSERKRLPLESPDQTPSSSLGPGSKGSTESGYFSSFGSAELSQVSPPNANVKSYAEIILGKYGRLNQQQRISHQHPQSSSSLGQEEKSISFPVPKTQVIEHITKLITINEAVVDTREIDSVKPRRSSLSRKSSMEAMKFSSSKDPILFDPMGDVPGSSSISRPVSYRGSAYEGHRTQSTEDIQAGLYPGGVLSRSQSVPSSSGKDELHSFRLSQSFDEQQATSAEMRIGHPHRMLRRQPAIEMPVGSDLVSEAGFSTSNVAEKEWKKQMELRLNTCELCGACLKKQDDFEAHKKSCKNLPSDAHPTEKLSGTIQEGHRQIMHYKFKAMAMAIRKRRKEESLEEDPLSPGPAAISCTTFPDTGPKDDFHGFSGIVSQIEPEPTGPYKGISVIQHTSSFEKQESISQEPEYEHKQSQEPKQTSTSRLVRQPKIQVPEILVTKEPDPETSSLTSNPSVSREPEKEFQWPQRSQSLSQLPAEKLPPKKKRLRLAEVQSSGESSFESVSLTRSPSQESNVSHISSHSASFEESGKTDPEVHAGSWSSQGSHMLTVPGTHQHYFSHREMQRSASEQAPASSPHSAQIAETRSKSFDCGSLPSKATSPSWKEKRKCLLVKHATLEKAEEPEESSSRLRLSLSGNIALSVDEHGTSNVARYCPDTLSESLFQHPLSFSTTSFPLTNPETCSLPQMTEFLPITTAISKGFSSEIFQQALRPPVPSLLHSRQLHLAEQLGLPVQPFPAMLSLQYPTSDPSIQDTSGHQIKDSTLSHSTYRSDSLGYPFVAQHQPSPIIATCLEQLRPVISLVVPVRLQTHIPTYGNAMYTTISQILATTRSQQPVSCTAMVIMERLEGSKFQQSYLRISPPCITLPLPLESGSEGVSGDDCWSLAAGGSKRMLSPAGSLELSLEAQRQQKRIKEEEKAEEIEDDFDKSSKKYLKESQETTKDEIKSAQKEDIVMVKEQESEVKKTESVETEITQVKTGVKTEEKLVEIPERSKDPMNFTLHTATSVSWCYLNYTKPNHSAHTNPQTSVYSSWSVSMYNPNLPGMSTKTVLSLLCSKQTHTSEMYTMATTSHLTTEKRAAIQKKTPKALEVHTKPPSTKVKDKEVQLDTKVDKEKRSTEEDPTTSKQSKPVRICIFEGGYKSNEEYIYVRGRGRGKYICGKCGIRCKKPSMLKKHIRTHTDIRPYVCKHCNFAFKTKGNLTKHMKSKSHGKKCQAMGVSESSVEELEAEEPGTSEGYLCESEDTEEHQFSDIEDSDDDDDDDQEEEDEDLSSHGGPPSSCSTDTRQSESGQSSQIDPVRVTLPESEERVSQASPLRAWSAGRASPDSKRMLFSRKVWEHSPLAFSPASDGSTIQNLSPRLELSSPSRHLSPSPERGPSPLAGSPLAGSPLRPLSPLRSLSPASFRSSRARLSSAPLGTQHRARSSPGHFHWELSSQSREGQQERPSTPSTVQSPQRLTPPHPSLVPSPLQFPFSDTPSYPPAMPRTTDCMFSHLPLHSQQQNRMPYHMIPIGGIQMVQLRHRSRPTLDRASSSTRSPLSRKEELTFSLNKCSLSTSWSSQPETSQAICEHTQSMKRGKFSLYSHATGSKTAFSSPAGDPAEQSVQDTKPYGSSLPSKTHTDIPETSQELGQETSERAKTDLELTEKETKASSHGKSEHLVPEKHKEGQSIIEEAAGQRPVKSGQSQDSSSEST